MRGRRQRGAAQPAGREPHDVPGLPARPAHAARVLRARGRLPRHQRQLHARPGGRPAARGRRGEGLEVFPARRRGGAVRRNTGMRLDSLLAGHPRRGRHRTRRGTGDGTSHLRGPAHRHGDRHGGGARGAGRVARRLPLPVKGGSTPKRRRKDPRSQAQDQALRAPPQQRALPARARVRRCGRAGVCAPALPGRGAALAVAADVLLWPHRLGGAGAHRAQGMGRLPDVVRVQHCGRHGRLRRRRAGAPHLERPLPDQRQVRLRVPPARAAAFWRRVPQDHTRLQAGAPRHPARHAGGVCPLCRAHPPGHCLLGGPAQGQQAHLREGAGDARLCAAVPGRTGGAGGRAPDTCRA
mmetsp:Transcript_40753/g.103220  ORF Transcript_40753/g.103220 Transcript_40753/m.103220 type:complete len:353 (-) Transcript_40753:808-1866(-)